MGSGGESLHPSGPHRPLRKEDAHVDTQRKPGWDHQEPTYVTLVHMACLPCRGSPFSSAGSGSSSPTDPELPRSKPPARGPLVPQRLSGGRPTASTSASPLCPLYSVPHARPAPWARAASPQRGGSGVAPTRPPSGRAVVSRPESHLYQSQQRRGLPGPWARGPAHQRRPGGMERWARRVEAFTAERATYLGQWGHRASGDDCWRSA